MGTGYQACSVEFSVKSGKHGTSTLSLVQNRVRLKKNLQKSTLAFKGVVGSNSEMRTTFCAKLSFHPVLTPSFVFDGRLHCCYIYFHCSYLYNYYNYLEPCALNGESQHFIPRFNNKNCLILRTSDKEGIGGVKRGPKTGWRQDDFKENSSV
jgi:hypothetical protein